MRRAGYLNGESDRVRPPGNVVDRGAMRLEVLVSQKHPAKVFADAFDWHAERMAEVPSTWIFWKGDITFRYDCFGFKHDPQGLIGHLILAAEDAIRAAKRAQAEKLETAGAGHEGEWLA